jgi:Family of unknown function (DUF6998)
MNISFDLSTLDSTIEAAKAVGKRYRELTGKPLGITGEVGEVLAARLLGLELSQARQAGYDTIGSDGRRVQIKSRCILPDANLGQVGAIRLDHQWDTVALILLDQDFEPLEIYEANRKVVENELLRPGSKSRNERGALAVSKFKAIGQLRWSRGPRPDSER